MSRQQAHQPESPVLTLREWLQIAFGGAVIVAIAVLIILIISFAGTAPA